MARFATMRSGSGLKKLRHLGLIETGGGGDLPASILDLSKASETFGAGEGSYTIAGHDVTYSYDGTAGPEGIGMVDGEITVTSSGGRACFVFDLGEALTDKITTAYLTLVDYTDHTSAGVMFQLADDTTLNHDAGHLQALVATGGDETTMRFRECTQLSPLVFNNIADVAIANVTASPIRLCMQWKGTAGSMSWDQPGHGTLPTDGNHLSNMVAEDYTLGAGKVARAGRRYLHVWAQTSVKMRLSVVSGPAASTWNDLPVGGGDTSQDTDGNVVTFDTDAKSYTIEDVSSSQPQGRRRDVVEVTAFTGIGWERVTCEIAYGTKPGTSTNTYDGFFVMNANSDAGIIAGGGIYFTGTSANVWSPISPTSDNTQGGQAVANSDMVSVVFDFYNGKYASCWILIKKADGTVQISRVKDVGAEETFTSLYVARVTGRESSGSGPDACVNTRSRWKHEVIG